MVDPKAKSRKRSRSKKRKPPPKGFTLYLDHNLDYDELVDKLDRAGIRYNTIATSFRARRRTQNC
jgi:hypothetical protein